MIYFLLIVGALIFLLLVALDGRNKAVFAYNYMARPLMTANEIEFFNRLQSALPNHHVFPQVALSAILNPSLTGNNRLNMATRSTFSQKVADYVVCNHALEVIVVVELDDKTHSLQKDAKRDSMLHEAGYRTIRWHSRAKPNPSEIIDAVIIDSNND